ncbi:MAG: tetratricopeptide repeat protein [Bacteroidota bacterium]
MEELDRRIAQYLAQELPPEEVKQFEQELEANPEMGRALEAAVRAEVAIQQQLAQDYMTTFTAKYQTLKKEGNLTDPGQIRAFWTTGLVAVVAAALALLFLWRGSLTETETYDMSTLYAQYYEAPEYMETKSAQATDSLWQITLIQLKSGQQETAIPNLQLLIADPSFEFKSEALLYLGHAYMEQKQFEKAIEAYQQVTHDLQTADWYMALAYIGQERSRAALRQLQKVQKYPYYTEKAQELIQMLERLNQAS